MSEDRRMISDEAVEAAVDALVASRLGDHKGINGEEFVEAARAALEAAVPYMLAEFEKWRKYEALDAISELGSDDPDNNPHRSQV